MKPIILAILDGWGYSKNRTGNPIREASTPTLDAIAASYPLLLLQASGLAVGLRWGDFGNSEVGHLTIGAGRVVQQYAVRIERAIKDGSFFTNPALLDAFARKRVHLVGLLTSGNVHAEYDHILALMDMAQRQPDVQVFLHLFTDGKDSGLQEGASLLEKLPYPVTTLIGRNFAMDRDNNWELTGRAHDLIAAGTGEATQDFVASVRAQYELDTVDTMIPPLVAPGYSGVQPGDAMIFFNFREDSIRQLYKTFADPVLDQVYVCSMTQYFDTLSLPAAFPPPHIENNLAQTLSAAGKRQFHIAETLKYAHVTFFFNGLTSTPYPGEEDVLIQSVKQIEAEPQMGAQQIADRVAQELERGVDFVVANFANADMLAHTGNHEATRLGVEAIDAALATLLGAVTTHDAIMLITSDHGNADQLIDRATSEPESRHSGSPVPCYVIGAQFKKDGPAVWPNEQDVDGILADVAPTILELMELAQPPQMSGVSLLPKLPARDR